MHAEQVPVLPIPESTCFADIAEYCEATIDLFTKKGAKIHPVLLFEVVGAPRGGSGKIELSAAPERMLIVVVEKETRNALLEALRRVEKREPKMRDPNRQARIKIKDNTPIKSIFKQMAAIPFTVFSITFAEDMANSVFFLRTAFTISELQKEIQATVIP